MNERPATRIALTAFARITGVALLVHLTTFFALLSALLGGFRERAALVDLQRELAFPHCSCGLNRLESQ